jgi:hypothetical protein
VNFAQPLLHLSPVIPLKNRLPPVLPILRAHIQVLVGNRIRNRRIDQ